MEKINYQIQCYFNKIKEHNNFIRGVIGEVRCSFLWIYAPTSYSAVFLLHAPASASIKISFGTVQFGLVRCGVGVVLRFELDLFGSD